MKIAKLRKIREMTQADLAQLCATSQQQIAKIEGGVVDPRLSTMRRMATALQCEVGDLFYTSVQFIKEVRDVFKRHTAPGVSMTLWHLNDLCQREADIPTFHPFWERVEIKGKKVKFKERKK